MEIRYKLPKGLQRQYLLEMERVSNLNSEEIGKLFGVVGRSYRDWRREKFTITQNAVNIIEYKWKLKLHYSKKKAVADWRKTRIEKSSKGGLVTAKKYGGPGTPEGRSKGGKKSIIILRERGLIPEPKPFVYPKKYSVNLAEFVGILIGDGHIGKEQWSITLNAVKDEKYSRFVIKLINKLFKFKPGISIRKDYNVIVITGSGIKSIEYFQKIGLKIGNKIKQQVDIPIWIKNNPNFKMVCLRGLMDTDGGVFFHRYFVNGKRYVYKKICFTNRSIPVLRFVYDVLKSLHYSPKLIDKVENKKVWLYNKQEVNRYLSEIQSNNFRLYQYKEI